MLFDRYVWFLLRFSSMGSLIPFLKRFRQISQITIESTAMSDNVEQHERVSMIMRLPIGMKV